MKSGMSVIAAMAVLAAACSTERDQLVVVARIDGEALVPALFGFNIGVEFGQILLIGIAGSLLAALRKWLDEGKLLITKSVLGVGLAGLA